MLTIHIAPHLLWGAYQEGYKVVIDRQADSGVGITLGKCLTRDIAEKLAGALGELINAEIATQVNDTIKFIRDYTQGHEGYWRVTRTLEHAAEQVVKVRIVDAEKEEQRKAAESAKLAEEREAKLRAVWEGEAREKIKAFESEMGTIVSSLPQLIAFVDGYIARKQRQRSEAQKVAGDLVNQK